MIIAISGRIGSGKDTVGEIIQYLQYRKTFRLSNEITEKNFNIFRHSLAHKDQVWKIKKFADKLKDMVCLLLNCTREQLEDREFKEKELGEEWWKYRIITKGLPNYYVNTLQEAEKQIRHENQRYVLVKLTPRKLLQLLGTECGRNIIHPNIWVNALMSELEIHSGKNLGEPAWEKIVSNWIITDMKFPNELKAVKDRGGISIRVNRVEGKEVVPNENWGSNAINIEKAVIVKDYGGREYLIKTSKGKKLNVYTDEVDFLYGNHLSETALDNAEFDYVIDNNSTIGALTNTIEQILRQEKIMV